MVIQSDSSVGLDLVDEVLHGRRQRDARERRRQIEGAFRSTAICRFTSAKSGGDDSKLRPA